MTLTKERPTGIEVHALRENAIMLARRHKKTCEGESCSVSLFLLYRLLQLAGIPMSSENVREFL